MGRPKKSNVYEVERVVSHRIVPSADGSKELEYNLKWKGYSYKDNTWEPASAVHAEDLVNEYWAREGGTENLARAMNALGKKADPKNEASTKRKASPEVTKKRGAKKAKVAEVNNGFYESESDVDVSESEVEDANFRSSKNWKDVSKIESVRPGDDGEQVLYGLVRWNDGKLAKYPTSLIAKKIPAMLIDYYEKRIMFERTNTTA